MIRYKVVYKKGRFSTNVGLYMEEHDGERIDRRSHINRFIASIYTKGTVVKAYPGSVGIFTFKTRKDAEEFIYREATIDEDFIILRVKPIGRGKKPDKILAWAISILGNYNFLEGYFNGEFSLLESEDLMEPYKGTICYPAVEVLD